MVLLGLGILFTSFTFLAFKYPPTTWLLLIRTWWQEHGRTQPTKELVGSNNAVDISTRTPTRNLPLKNPPPPEKESPEKTKDGKIPNQTSQIVGGGPINSESALPVPSFTLLDATASGNVDPPPSSQAPTTRDAESLKIFPTSYTPATLFPLSSTSAMAPPGLPASASRQPPKAQTNLLMPASTKPSALRPLPKTVNLLNPPLSAAAAMRALPNELQTPKNSLPASFSTLAPSARPSKKVTLMPGHSPLDWAHLASHPPTPTFLRGASVPPHLIKVTPSQLKKHNGRKGQDAWSTWQGRVYNITPYLKFHPGGERELLRGAGKPGEAERLFLETHPWVNWEGILGECTIGILVAESERISGNGASDLDAMD